MCLSRVAAQITTGEPRPSPASGRTDRTGRGLISLGGLECHTDTNVDDALDIGTEGLYVESQLTVVTVTKETVS